MLESDTWIELASYLAMVGAVWLILWFLLRFMLAPINARWIANGVTLTLLAAVLIAVGLKRSGLMDSSHLDHLFIVGLLLALNLVLLPFLYWWDKRLAVQDDEMRIPEVVLHGFALVGGGLGAFASQRLLRHKTRKRRFQMVTWVALLVSAGLYYAAYRYIWG